MSRESHDTFGEVRTRSSQRTARPPLYRVMLHNDDFTTMEFVVEVLVSVFHREYTDAVRVMLDVHTQGVGVAGVYSYEIAETKAAKVMRLAREREFPLMCSLQED